MRENKDRNVLPHQFILNLFDKTKDTKLAITYYPTNGEQRINGCRSRHSASRHAL